MQLRPADTPITLIGIQQAFCSFSLSPHLLHASKLSDCQSGADGRCRRVGNQLHIRHRVAVQRSSYFVDLIRIRADELCRDRLLLLRRVHHWLHHRPHDTGVAAAHHLDNAAAMGKAHWCRWCLFARCLVRIAASVSEVNLH